MRLSFLSSCTLLGRNPFLVETNMDIYNEIKKWKRCQQLVPRCGGVILDPTNSVCLLVQGMSRMWSFPRGKIEENETYRKCAVREVSIKAKLSCFSNLSVCLNRFSH